MKRLLMVVLILFSVPAFGQQQAVTLSTGYIIDGGGRSDQPNYPCDGELVYVEGSTSLNGYSAFMLDISQFTALDTVWNVSCSLYVSVCAGAGGENYNVCLIGDSIGESAMTWNNPPSMSSASYFPLTRRTSEGWAVLQHDSLLNWVREAIKNQVGVISFGIRPINYSQATRNYNCYYTVNYSNGAYHPRLTVQYSPGQEAQAVSFISILDGTDNPILLETPTTNWGDHNMIDVRAGPGKTSWGNALKKFDIPAWLDTCLIDSAFITLTQNTSSASVRFGAYLLKVPFNESQATWQRRTTDTLWHSNGADGAGYDYHALPSTETISNSGGAGTKTRFDATELVEKITGYNKTLPNYGFLFRGQDTANVVSYFASEENLIQSYRPELKIYYAPLDSGTYGPPPDTTYTSGDTVYVTTHDTIFVTVHDTMVMGPDTVWVPGDTVQLTFMDILRAYRDSLNAIQ